MSTSPTARSLRLLHKAGYTAGVVERRLPRRFIIVGIFGCIDLVGIKADERGVPDVQVTTTDYISHRLAKVKAVSDLRTWLAAGNGFEVHVWVKHSWKWIVDRVAGTGDDLQAAVIVRSPKRGHRQRSLFE